MHPRHVTPQTATVWLAPTAGRRYLTKRSAINAEARALILAKHPTEQAERDEIGQTYPGWHWSNMPRAEVLLRRVKRLVERHVTKRESE